MHLFRDHNKRQTWPFYHTRCVENEAQQRFTSDLGVGPIPLRRERETMSKGEKVTHEVTRDAGVGYHRWSTRTSTRGMARHALCPILLVRRAHAIEDHACHLVVAVSGSRRGYLSNRRRPPWCSKRVQDCGPLRKTFLQRVTVNVRFYRRGCRTASLTASLLPDGACSRVCLALECHTQDLRCSA